MYKIIITKPAEQDIEQAAQYIAKELQNPIAANELLDDIEIAITSLEIMPKRHPLVKSEDLASLGIRILPVHNYLAFYLINENKKTVTIERFLHGRRNWLNIIG